MTYLKYKPTDAELRVIESDYWEAWEGLPQLKFETVKANGVHESWRYEKNGSYVWVPSDALAAFRENSQAPFLAFMEKTASSSIHAKWLIPTQSLEQAIKEATKANYDKLVQAKKAKEAAYRQQVAKEKEANVR